MTDDELKQEFAKISRDIAAVDAKVDALDTKVTAISDHLGVGEEMENIRTIERSRGSVGGLAPAAKGQ